MALKDKLTTEGSLFSYGDGQTPLINPLSTQQSKLHVKGNKPGYSIDGSEFQEVNAAFQAYNDGTGNTLPQPSQLDLNGTIPPKYSDIGPVEGFY